MTSFDSKRTGVTLLAYSRPKHLAQVLEAIRRHGVRHLTVFMDGPETPQIAARQEEIQEVVSGIRWAECRLIRRDRNLGLARSVVSAITSQLELYNRMILIEDDCVPREHFFEFMEHCLDTYEHAPEIRSVCGYQFPFAPFPGDEIRAVRLRRFMPWGWATWADRWRDFTFETERLAHEIAKRGLVDTLPPDLVRYCSHAEILDGRADIWSTNWILVHYLTRTWAVYPTHCLIDNIGFDGSGVHCVETSDFLTEASINGRRIAVTSGVPEIDERFDREVSDYLDRCSHQIMFKLPCANTPQI